MRLRLSILGFAVLGCLAVDAATIKPSIGFEIIPQTLALHGPSARQRLLVESVADGHDRGQLTNDLTLKSDNPDIVRVEGGVAVPVANGTATISVTVGGQTAKAQVQVEAMDRPINWSFRNDVQPVLAKLGCNAGACHGAAAGQNGFKLSLRGYDNEGDYLALTHQALGRRVIPSDPGRSLMLLKPTRAVPHKGGKRFEVGSVD
jgi:hypothetical protein